MIKVSVVVPVYNVELYLRQCLDSILGQTLKEIEVICVDDGSTDDSVEILEEYQLKDERVKILKQNNSYAGVARNYGMSVASGEYIIFLDSDDFFEKEMLKTMYERCRADSADVCICGGGVYNERDHSFKAAPHYLNTSYLPENIPFSARNIKERIFNFVSPAPWNKLFLRKFILDQKIEFQNLRRTNDMYFVYLALACAERITVEDQWFVNYRIGNENSLQATNAKSPFDWYTALLALRKALRERKLFAEFEQSYKNRALDVAIYNLNRAKTAESYSVIFEHLKTECFYNLEVIGHTKPYFYNQNSFSQMIAVMESSAEEAWKKKADDSVKREEATLIDIEKWKCPEIEVDLDKAAVSVIIPVYNVEEYLEECLGSVIKQSLKNIEIICVDDGSTDNSIEILNRYKHDDDRIIILRKENGGLSSARNAGMKIASGEYIYFLDSDDYLDLKALEFLYYEAKKDNLDQLFFSADTFFDNLGENHGHNSYQDYYKRYEDYSQVVTGKEYFVQVVKNAEFKPSACLQILRTEFVNAHYLEFMNGLIHEDQLFTTQCLAFSERVRYVNINLYKRRMREESIMTGTKEFRHAYAYYKIIKELMKFAEKYHLGQYAEYYGALIIHLERLRDSACKSLNIIDEETLNYELSLLGDMEQMDFYFYICSYNAMKVRAYRLNLRAKAAEENAKSQVLKKQYQIDKLRIQVKTLETENNLAHLKLGDANMYKPKSIKNVIRKILKY